MPQPNTINPYPLIGVQLQDGLNAIIAALPASPTIDELVTEVYNFVKPLYYANANTQVSVEIKSVAYNAVNSYRNSLVLTGLAEYKNDQPHFIEMLIGASMTSAIATDSIIDRIADIEDNIGTSELTINEQTPLFLATTLGRNAAQYWRTQIDLGGGSSWANHFSTNAGQNYLNELLWAVAAMNGALSSYGACPTGLIEPTTASVTTKMVSALIGALTVSAGKVLFNWIPRITKPLSINRERVGNLSNIGRTPFNGTAYWITSGCTDGCRCYSHWRCTKGGCTGDCTFTQSAGICPLPGEAS
jgi:hypothetical protein